MKDLKQNVDRLLFFKQFVQTDKRKEYLQLLKPIFQMCLLDEIIRTNTPPLAHSKTDDNAKERR